MSVYTAVEANADTAVLVSTGKISGSPRRCSPWIIAGVLSVAACVATTLGIVLSPRPNNTGSSNPSGSSTLWTYVNQPDPAFSWNDTGILISGSTSGLPWDAYVLNVTSGTWLTPADSTCSLWTHTVVVIVPRVLSPSLSLDHAAIYITGGSSSSGIPSPNNGDIMTASALAINTGTISSIIFQVPNQPCIFAADPKKQLREEDDIIAFSWNQYLAHPSQPDWVVFFPMTRAVSRAMDAVTAFVQRKWGAQYTLGKWLTYGASKRGWTTWWTGVAEARVKMIAPLVMDLLNFLPGVENMWTSLGNWTYVFEPYLNERLPGLFGTSQIDPLLPLIDPFLSKENLTMPKLVVTATGDEFFLVDNDKNWWGQLPGESYRLIESNTEHSLSNAVPSVLTSVSTFWLSVMSQSARPVYNWTLDLKQGSITAEVFGDIQPVSVNVTSTMTLPGSCKAGVTPCVARRDFRLVTGNTEWDPCPYLPVDIFGQGCLRPINWMGHAILPVFQNSTYSKWFVKQDMPPAGYWTGFMLEFYFPIPGGLTYKLTTQAAVIPDSAPFQPCVGDACMKSLV